MNMAEFGNIEQYKKQALENTASRIRARIKESQEWDLIFPIMGVEEILADKRYWEEYAYSRFLTYLLRRHTIPHGEYIDVSDLVIAFSNEGIDAFALFTIPHSPFLPPQESRIIYGKRFCLKNTRRGIMTIHINEFIYDHKLCRINAQDFVDCFLKACEIQQELSVIIDGILMAERISYQTLINS